MRGSVSDHAGGVSRRRFGQAGADFPVHRFSEKKPQAGKPAPQCRRVTSVA